MKPLPLEGAGVGCPDSTGLCFWLPLPQNCLLLLHHTHFHLLQSPQVFNVDRSNKTVVVEEGMTAGMVCHLLVVKNHFDESPNWVLVEQLGDVSLGEQLAGEASCLLYSLRPVSSIRTRAGGP